ATAPAPLSRTGPGSCVLRGSPETLGANPDRGPGADAEPGTGPARESLAALPGAELPPLGSVGLLPVRRRVRVPRSAPGRDGAGLRRPAGNAGTASARRPAPVPGRRRAALVAPARRPRRAHPHFRRLPVVAVCRLSLRARDR